MGSPDKGQLYIYSIGRSKDPKAAELSLAPKALEEAGEVRNGKNNVVRKWIDLMLAVYR